MTRRRSGTVVAVKGSVVDIRFPDGVPRIRSRVDIGGDPVAIGEVRRRRGRQDRPDHGAHPQHGAGPWREVVRSHTREALFASLFRSTVTFTPVSASSACRPSADSLTAAFDAP